MVEMPVPPALQAAYGATAYRVWLPAGGLGEVVELRVGQACPALSRHLAGQPGGWMVITASNPGSRRLSAAENRARQEALAGLLRSLNLPFLAAENVADDGLWPVEPGFFVAAPVLDRELARALGQRWGQLAVLYGDGPDGAAELLWCGEAPA